MKRLHALGAWLQLNGEAIHGTHPWKRPVGETSEGMKVRFTQKDSAVYATPLGQPTTATVTIKNLSPGAGAPVYLLGNPKPLVWDHRGDDTRVYLPSTLPGQYAYVQNDRPNLVTHGNTQSHGNRLWLCLASGLPLDVRFP